MIQTVLKCVPQLLSFLKEGLRAMTWIPSMLINNEKINRALKKNPHMQKASFNQGGRGQSICWSEVDTYHQQDGGLFAMCAVPFGGAPCSREAPSRLLYGQHFKRSRRSPNQQLIIDQCFRGIPGHAADARCSGDWLQLLPGSRQLSEGLTEPPWDICREEHLPSVLSHTMAQGPVACSSVCALNAQNARPGRD